MTERSGCWIKAKNHSHLEKIIAKLDEYLFDVQYEIMHRCDCGKIEAFVHYIV